MASTPQWLKSAVFYEIYPQSFNDTNADGIGDLPGIIEKLDYIESLGCNAIWIHPCFVSPFDDAGYDVSDYYKVAPRYGTNADMKRLIKAAKKKGIRICLDLVPGHTSVEHPWFKQSAQLEHNEYSNRFIWSDGWVVDTAPQRSINGSALREGGKFIQRNGSYVINFFWCQPALNYGYAKPDPEKKWQLPADHPDCLATREEMKKVMRFWMDMGVAGFRIDMASSLIKNDPGHKENIKLWQDVRKMLDKDYPEAVIIAEWLNPPEAVEGGFHVDFASIFSASPYQALFRAENNANVHFEAEGHSYFDRQGKGDASAFVKEYQKMTRKLKDDGFVGFYSSNHDISRIAVNRSQKDVELTFAFLMTMPGVPFIYYGDEIGMRFCDELPSKEGGYTRTGSRTPMQWSGGKNAGFSSGKAKDLYLPVDKAKNAPNVADQDAKPRSLLNAVRKLTALRNATPALQADGAFKPIYAEKNAYPLVYLRSDGDKKFLVAINPSGKAVQASFKVPGVKAIGKCLAGSGATVSKADKLFQADMKKCSYGVFECE